jgi:branched-chain amino acid transport system permease protein
MWKVLGMFSFDLRGKTAYVYALVVVFALFVLARRLVASPFGLGLRGIRQGAKRMPAIGAPVGRRLVTIYTISAAMAGVAGGLLAQTTQFVGIDSFSFARSADLMVMLVLGGTGRLYGALIGAAVFMIAQDVLSGINPVYWQFWIGMLLVVIVLFARGGILGGIDVVRARLRKPR